MNPYATPGEFWAVERQHPIGCRRSDGGWCEQAQLAAEERAERQDP